MTRNEIMPILQDAADKLSEGGFSVVVDEAHSYQWPDLHYLFLYDGENLGSIGITLPNGAEPNLGLFWECKWYCCPMPNKGEYRGLYQYVNGTETDADVFVRILLNKGIAGERRKRKDLKKKELIEERELL